MICLCCGKEIKNQSEKEMQFGWHKKCIEKFFGTSSVPELEIEDQQLTLLAKASVDAGYTIQGVQKKMSLHLTQGPAARLTIVDYPNGYILKPQTEKYRNLPEYEHMTMLMAEEVGVRTVPHALIRLKDQYAYITKRVDREIEKGKCEKFAMEDFCQLSGRLTEDKYRGSYEQCSKIIHKYSCRPQLDLAEFYLRLIFCYISGNSDMHLKNFSLRELTTGKRDYVLAEGYDLLPVNIVNPMDLDETALALNGKKRNLTKKDFLMLAENCGITQAAAKKIIQSVVRKQDKLKTICEQALLDEEQKTQMLEFMEKRIERLA